MPELPDLTIYLEALRTRVQASSLVASRIVSPFLVRTVDPPIPSFHGDVVTGFSRIGKRLVFEFGKTDRYFVLHLMIAGRLQWRPRDAPLRKPLTLAAFDFERGSLHLTEASKKKRASLHAVAGRSALLLHDPGGLEPLTCSAAEFEARLRSENHTLKRALTDPSLFAAIGNAYSDEILHRARLSPVMLTQRLTNTEAGSLHAATVEVLEEWIARSRDEAGMEFPSKVTAFREGMAVHGRFGEPCPRCGTKVQRIVHAENESNYCPQCQTGGKLLADRALSRLLRGDWPKTLEELEERKRRS